jgi:hypothetical protein
MVVLPHKLELEAMEQVIQQQFLLDLLDMSIMVAQLEEDQVAEVLELLVTDKQVEQEVTNVVEMAVRQEHYQLVDLL